MVRGEDDVEEEADLHEEMLDRRGVADPEHPAHHVGPEPERARPEGEHEPAACEQREAERRAGREGDGGGDRRPDHPQRRQAEASEDEPIGEHHVHGPHDRPDRERRPRVARPPEARDHDEEESAGGHAEHHDAEEPRPGQDDGVVDVEGGDERRRPDQHGHDHQDRDGGRREERLAERLLRGAALARPHLARDDGKRTHPEGEHHGVHRPEDLNAHADTGHRRPAEPADHEHVTQPDERLDREGEDDRPRERPRRPQQVGLGRTRGFYGDRD